jgi:hypothetical protein
MLFLSCDKRETKILGENVFDPRGVPGEFVDEFSLASPFHEVILNGSSNSQRQSLTRMTSKKIVFAAYDK